jgi:spore coat polysaccharide biosynthesis protein SpsF
VKTVAIVQARMTSTRLPGKVLLDLAGRPVLARVVERLRACARVNEICLAITTNAADDPLEAFARQEKIAVVRGPEQDVLARYVAAARSTGADAVVRITSDCPLLDPEVTDRVIGALTVPTAVDYAANVLERTYPRGLDTEAFFLDTLLRIDRLATSAMAREHVTVFLRSERPDLFKTRHVRDRIDNSDLRWTLDTPADLTFLRAVFERWGPTDPIQPYAKLAAALRAEPALLALNHDAETWDPAGASTHAVTGRAGLTQGMSR